MPWSDGTAIVASSVQVGPVAGSTGSIVIEPEPDVATGVIMKFFTGDAIEQTPATIESSVVGGDQVLGLNISSAGIVGDFSTNFPANIGLQSQGTGGEGSQIQFGVSTHGDTTEFAVIIDGATQTMQLFGPGVGFFGAITADTWTTPVVGSGWSVGPAGGSFLGVRYRADSEDNLIIVGTMHTTSATPAATLFTLDANHRPQTNQREPIVSANGTAVTALYVEIDTTGVVKLSTTPAAANVDVHFRVQAPLGTLT
jgi:hypothetical protein